MYAVCEQKGTNENTIDFEANWLNEDEIISKICAKSLTVIKGGNVVKDAFVKASYSSEYTGQIDEISQVCKIGVESLGLKLH